MVKVINSQIKENILRDLNKLPIELQKKVYDFINALLLTLPKGNSPKNVLSFSGIMNKQDAKEISTIIEEGCEKIDEDEW